MGKEHSFLKMEINMKAIFRIINCMVKDFINMQIKRYIMDNGIIIREMGLGHMSLMMRNMKDSGRMIYIMDLDC